MFLLGYLSYNIDEHCNYLRIVFGGPEKKGFSVDLRKCRENFVFPDHEISSQGIFIELNLKITELRAFLGLTQTNRNCERR